uniref:IQ motif containing B1 n=1 Tax=Mola mola TaxID=94237 RepID=A0A3Q4BE54_MOLML
MYLSGVLTHCVQLLSLEPRQLWGISAILAQLARFAHLSCCVGVEPGEHSAAFHRLFLPSVMNSLLSLAGQLMMRPEVRGFCASLFRKVMDSVGRLLTAHTQLAAQVLSSVHYERIQMREDASVCLLCIQLWTRVCTSNFVSGLSDDTVLLLLNEVVAQLAVSSDPAVGGASWSFASCLDSLLDKDWRGRGFDQDVDQLIRFIQSDKGTRSYSQASTEHVQAACVIQAAWRSYQTRRRVKSLSRAVSTLQRRYRYLSACLPVCLSACLSVCLPIHQVQTFLQECQRRAAVVIQSSWRGLRERRHCDIKHRLSLRNTQQQQQAARTLQRAVRRFLQKRRADKAPPITPFWIGHTGLTDSRRVELKRQVEEYISLHPSSRVSREECERLHEEVQLLLLSELQRGALQRREEERTEALLAHVHTQLELLRDAPPLSDITASEAESFLSPSGPIAARARDAHNAMLQASRLPWWRTLGDPAGVDKSSPAHLLELEAELGGLFIGGISKHTEVDGIDL